MELKLLADNTYKDCMQYEEQLISMCIDYFQEAEGDNFVGTKETVTKMIVDFVMTQKKTIYLLVEKDELIGFLVVYINDQYGNLKPVVFTEYMYVKPEYRSGRAIMYLYTMLGIISEEYDCDAMGSTLIDSPNIRNNKIVNGTVIAELTRFPLEEIKQKTKLYKKRILNG